MALLNDEQKQNFDTTFTGNYDDGSGLNNPQPLNVDNLGNLIVSQPTNYQVYNYGRPYCVGEEYRNFNDVISNLPTLRRSLISQLIDDDFTKIYCYAENITTNSGSGDFYVFVSCYGGN